MTIVPHQTSPKRAGLLARLRRENPVNGVGLNRFAVVPVPRFPTRKILPVGEIGSHVR